jgi:2-polyprenyl-3-methyl-5-hydroxy-6-metoxy-1,4-benzoquinol methylase
MIASHSKGNVLSQPSTESHAAERPADFKAHMTQVCPSCGSANATPIVSAPDRFHGRTTSYEIVKCQNCALAWLNHPPAAEEMSQHYGSDYDRAIATIGEAAPDRWNSRCETLAKYKDGGRILDLGCSSGSFLSSLPLGRWELHGIEMSAEVARRAEARCGVKVFVGDILDAQFPSQHFDAITCLHVFEHLYQPKEVLARVANWLKPGGVFFALMPNIESAGFRFFRSYWYALELPRHLFHFSPQSLTRLADSAGLRVLSLKTEREIFFEHSARYVLNDLAKRAGVKRLPAASARPPGIPFRIVRKAFRLTALPVINGFIGLGGDKELIEAVFQR